MSPNQVQLSALASIIGARRKAIMTVWRSMVEADPKLTAGASLPHAQLQDHIPALLEDYERRLQAGSKWQRAKAEDEQVADAAAHGLHRWQQGFDLGEVTRELGRLNECVVAELESCAAAEASLTQAAMAEARQVWAGLYGVAVSSSTSQYFKLQQIEAASHVKDLELALTALRELETQRAQLWQQAAHDLRGNLGVVATATAGLTSTRASDEARAAFVPFLARNVRALHRLLEDVTSLARLQGGQERRSLAAIDASLLMREIGESMQPLADEKRLELRLDGPASWQVPGDAVKTRRIVQNLLLNALRYTQHGSVNLSWGPIDSGDAARWFIQIADTGPGFHAGPGSALAGALEFATDRSREMDDDAKLGAVTHANTAPAGARAGHDDSRPVHQQRGEGIGLSIVKRLCEMLDATIEVDSKPNVGTTFRILLPRQYADV